MTTDIDHDLGRALLTGLLQDSSIVTGGRAVPDALARHRQDLRSWYGDLVGPLQCPTSRVPDLLGAFGDASVADPVAIVLVADSGVLGVERAKNLLLDEDRTELVGVRLALPLGGDPTAFAGRVLEALTFAVPAIIDVPYQPGWEGAVEVLAADGAERVGLRAGSEPEQLADQLHSCAARRLTILLDPDVRGLTPGDAPGLLNLLAATASAVTGGPPEGLLTALTASDLDLLAATATAAAPARTRALLAAVTDGDVRATVAELVTIGFLAESD